ncbi:hypothetical protein CERSUDRAFT_112420 [Gelatoporia subvermispora B]|uniref:Cation/H+ exchanger transmembrane domain-containing protein n=1 Tax=Ceriporiopsis subvermispora (strain B) TaxID=914234 RepID=M2QT55_CERS8|nr:hypothetical protein CERSUDRAFT_112420 [Gelatoporia subvermispora B]
MPEFSDAIIHIGRTLLRKRDSAGEPGLLDGADPTAFDTSDPLRIWIIQVGVIIMTTQLLSLILGKIKQPKVIAEVIGGILLGPTAFGRIPGFTEHIFPDDSKPYLSLVANIGLCLFLFLVGLEIDLNIIKRNARLSMTIALAGMVLPFGLGAALSVPLYHTFIDQSVKFTNFMLFTGVAYSITAFPVLCRILTELNLLDTTVGIVVLSAGIGNDIVGWTLLALAVALVNAGSGLTALWILLACVGWALFLLFPVKRAFLWLAKRTGSIENEPTMLFMTVTVLLVFGSGFFTDIIGVQAIFGAFLAGVIVPREGGLAIALTEKLEDMISIIFLPLYFTLSGLQTNLGLLNDGITWAFTIAICALAYFGKFGGCTVAARLAGFSWREASTIGSLMSCKGLVELIVLNVGLQAGILSQRVFSMFVLEAVVLTFMTTPAVNFLYPPEARTRAAPTGPNFSTVDEGGEGGGLESSRRNSIQDEFEGKRKTRFTVILDRLEHLSGMMALTQLLQPPPPTYTEKEREASPTGSGSRPSSAKKPTHMGISDVAVDALRLIELSDRTSAVMKSSNADILVNTDPLLDIFRTFGDLNNLPVSTSLAIVSYDDLATRVAEHARRNSSQLVLVPWLPPTEYSVEPASANAHSDAFAGTESTAVTPRASSHTNPFETLFRTSNVDLSASALHSHFVRMIFAQSGTDVALYVDRHQPGDAPKPLGGAQHLFLPFFGGPDDRLALEFVVQLCANPRVSATVVRVRKPEFALCRKSSIQKPEAAHIANTLEDHTARSKPVLSNSAASQLADTVYRNSQHARVQSETADNLIWERYAAHELQSDSPLSAVLSRIEFSEVSTPFPLHNVTERAALLYDNCLERGSRMLAVVGRSRRLAADNQAELKQLMDAHGTVTGEVRRTVGDITVSLVISGCKASVVVLQAAAEAAPES